MIHPTVEELSAKKGGGTTAAADRYAITIATAKCARIVTEEYSRARNDIEGRISRKETDKPIAQLMKKDICEEKAICVAIKRLQAGQFVAYDAEGDRISGKEPPTGSIAVKADEEEFI
jgi:hypothetical protein